MKVDERDRQSLRERLDTVLGEQPAEVLMDMLERASGHEPATHDDMLALGTRLDGIDARLDQMDRRLDQVDTRFEMVDVRFEKLDARFESRTADLTRSVVFTGIGVAMSSWGPLFAALGFG